MWITNALCGLKVLNVWIGSAVQTNVDQGVDWGRISSRSGGSLVTQRAYAVKKFLHFSLPIDPHHKNTHDHFLENTPLHIYFWGDILEKLEILEIHFLSGFCIYIYISILYQGNIKGGKNPGGSEPKKYINIRMFTEPTKNIKLVVLTILFLV
jgi:hypothetical protein